MFKSAITYKFNEGFELKVEQIEEALNQKQYREIGGHEAEVLTASHFVKGGESYSYTVQNDYVFMQFTQQERLLPSVVVNTEVSERVEVIKQAENRAVSRKERTEIKDDVIFELLPKAFIVRKNTMAMFSLKDRRLFINTTSAAKADNITALLRECLGSLAITPISNVLDIKNRLTGWLKNTPKDFEMLEEFEMKAAIDAQSKVKFKHLSLHSKQVEEYIEEGLLLSDLRLSFKESVDFTLKENGFLSRIVYAEKDEAHEDEEAERHAKAFLTGKILNSLTDRLEEEFKIVENT